jgi:lipoate-protein ligase A
MGCQLAHTEALFEGLAAGWPPTIRWYRPTKPALVLGHGQAPEHADLAAARAAGVPVFRRTSGGAAVWIDRAALSLDIALPVRHPLISGDVTLAYRWVGKCWAAALRELGIVSTRAIPTDEVRALAPLAPDDPLRLACYGALSPWEAVVGERKVVGLSQIRRRAGVLYPIGVHLRWRPERLTRLLALAPRERRALNKSLRQAAAGLDQLAGRAIPAIEVMAAVERALVRRHGVILVPGDWSAAEEAAAERLERERFQPLG